MTINPITKKHNMELSEIHSVGTGHNKTVSVQQTKTAQQANETNTLRQQKEQELNSKRRDLEDVNWNMIYIIAKLEDAHINTSAENVSSLANRIKMTAKQEPLPFGVGSTDNVIPLSQHEQKYASSIIRLQALRDSKSTIEKQIQNLEKELATMDNDEASRLGETQQ